MLESLMIKNDIPMFSVYDDQFRKYGAVTDGFNTDGIISADLSLPFPESGTLYTPSVDELESLPIAEQIKTRLFGEMPMQMGRCCGHNSLLNALEWHNCNEVNIAVTDAVLILAKRADMNDYGRMDSAVCNAFFVPKGTVIEVYSDTLHFCPCQTDDSGFRMIVCLAKGTNTSLDGKSSDKRLWAKNKWLLAHDDNKPLIERGAVAGIYGENYQIKY